MVRDSKRQIIFRTIIKVVFILNFFSCKGQNAVRKEATLPTAITTNKKVVSTKSSCLYDQKILDFILEQGMKPVSEVKLSKSKILGGHGLPYVYGVSMQVNKKTNRIPANVLFWAEKDGKEALFFAEDDFSNNEKAVFKIASSISKEELAGHSYDIDRSYGLVPYDGALGVTKDLSNFKWVKNRKIEGPKGVLPTLRNGFWSILIYQESSLQVLYYYQKKWWVYTQTDI